MYYINDIQVGLITAIRLFADNIIIDIAIKSTIEVQ